MDRMYRVLIVEDDPMARKLLEIFIQESEQFELAGAIESAAMAELYCLTGAIDLILMDVCTAMNANGLDAAEKIKKSYPEIRIIIITSQPEYSFIDRAQALGIDSFWYKSGDAGEILSVMTRTMGGELVYPDAPPVLRLGNALSAELTERELEVLRELTEGQADAEIAEKLHMSLRTVKGIFKACGTRRVSATAPSWQFAPGRAASSLAEKTEDRKSEPPLPVVPIFCTKVRCVQKESMVEYHWYSVIKCENQDFPDPMALSICNAASFCSGVKHTQ